MRHNILVLIIAASVLLQFMALLWSARFIVATGKRIVGALVITTMSLMGFRRVISLSRALTSPAAQVDFYAEIIALVISLLMLVGIIYLTRVMLAEKKTTDSLIKSEAHLRKAQELAKVGSWEWEIATNRLTWSDETFHLYGMDKSTSPKYEAVLNTLHPECRERFIRAVEDSLTKGQPFEGEFRIVRSDGTERSTHTKGEVIRDENGSAVIMLGVVQDTTERKEAEEKIKFFSHAIEETADGIHLVDLKGNIFYANQANEKILGYTKRELLGKTVRDLTDDRHDHDSAIAAILESGRWDGEITAVRKDGTTVPIWLTVALVKDDSCEPIAMLGIFRDITERKEAEERLRTALADQETLLRELYHRTKNNMQVIISLINLQTSDLEDPRAVQFFRDTQNRIRAMAILHEKLYHSGNLSHVNLKGYIEDLIRSLADSLQIDSARLKIGLTGADIALSIDVLIPTGLVLNELITNSVKHAFGGKKNGTIDINAVYNDQAEIEIRYKDDGPGLPASLDMVNTKSLGLKLVHNLVTRQLGGRLDIGDGSEFIIRFKEPERKSRV